MTRLACFLLAALAGAATLGADDASDVVFRSDVSLIRVDAQVVDRGNHALTNLEATDFILLEDGKQQEIRNFAREDMPADVLLLLDVSGSMRPHVERIARASHDALLALGNDDRIAVMVFDRATRVRMPFKNSRADVERELENVVHQETFDGGTDITRALLDAARYIGREGRKDARRAIVILTDDQTERDRDEGSVNRALTSANAVLSALIAPDAMRSGSIRGPMGGGGGGGGWPTGPSIGGPLGGIIFGRRGGYPGTGRYPRGGGYPGGGYPGGGGPVIMRPHTQSAGTSEIARSSGGDSLRVDEASAFETTLARLRQRYALHFHLPAGVRPGQERNIEVELADATRRRYPGAEVRFRRSYIVPSNIDPQSEPVVVSQAPPPASPNEGPHDLKRRPAVSEPHGSWSDGPATPQTATEPATGGWRRETDPAKAAAAPAAPAAPEKKEEQPQRGWRKLKPGEQP